MVVAEVVVGRRRVIFGLGLVVASVALLGAWLVVRRGRGRDDLLGRLGRPVVLLVG